MIPMGTYEGQLAGWMTPEAAARPEADSYAAVAGLVHQYSATLYRVAYSVTRNAGEAEDVVQETFLRVLRHHEKLVELRDPRIWLVRITWNLVLDRKRRSKARPETDDIEDLVRVLPGKERGAEEELIAAQGYARILGLIDELPSKEREALLLSAVEELSTVQIAVVLHTTESTIRSRIFRARRMLAAKLEQRTGRR